MRRWPRRGPARGLLLAAFFASESDVDAAANGTRAAKSRPGGVHHLVVSIGVQCGSPYLAYVSPDEAEQGQSTVPRMVGEAEGVAVVNRR